MSGESRSQSRPFASMCYLFAIAAVPQPLNAQLIGDVTVTVSSRIISDGVSYPNAKSIPSAVIEYTTRVANQSTTPLTADSLIVTNPIPQNLKFYVGDITASGSGPVMFTEGVVPSKLACLFEGFLENGDCIDFSNDGGATFNYRPTPDAEGYDAAVTHIRIRPQGTMAPAIIQPSSFELHYRMKVN